MSIRAGFQGAKGATLADAALGLDDLARGEQRTPWARPTMWFDLRKEQLAFVQRAPLVYGSEAEVPVPRALVFATFVEPQSWKHWFPNVRDASYATPPPHGVGTIREARVGRTDWVEEMIAWDEGARWAWTVTRASVPFAAAQVESFDFTDAGSGTRVRWTLALEPRLLARLGAPFAPRVITRLFHRALQNLGAYVQRNTREGQRE